MKRLALLLLFINSFYYINAQNPSNTDYMVVSQDFTVCNKTTSDSIEFVVITNGVTNPLFNISPTILGQAPVLDRLSNDALTWIYKLPVKQQYIDQGQVTLSIGRECQTTNNFNVDAECLGQPQGHRVFNDELVITFVENSIQPVAPEVIGVPSTATEVLLESPRYGLDYPLDSVNDQLVPPNIFVVDGSGDINYVNFIFPETTQIQYTFDQADYNSDTLMFIHEIEPDFSQCDFIQDTILVVFDLPTSVTNDELKLSTNVFPNPTSDLVKVQLEKSYNDANIVLLNSYGEQIGAARKLSNDLFEFSLASLPAGIYYIQVFVEGKTFAKPILKN